MPDDELGRLLALFQRADRVEHKFIVPASAHETVSAALGVDFARAPTRRVYYLDTDDLAFHRHGVVTRVRSIAGRPDDSVIKLRPVVPGRLARKLRRSKTFVVDVDVMPGAYVCSGTLKTRLGQHAVHRTMARGGPLRALFSKPQRRLLAEHAPAHIGIDELTVFGPVDVRIDKISPRGAGGTLVIQQWTYPDGSRSLELSTRSLAAAAPQSAARTVAFLRTSGIDLTGPQQTKTRTTLDYFTRRRPPS